MRRRSWARRQPHQRALFPPSFLLGLSPRPPPRSRFPLQHHELKPSRACCCRAPEHPLALGACPCRGWRWCLEPSWSSARVSLAGLSSVSCPALVPWCCEPQASCRCPGGSCPRRPSRGGAVVGTPLGLGAPNACWRAAAGTWGWGVVEKGEGSLGTSPNFC